MSRPKRSFSSKRSRRGGVRADEAALREAFRDQRMWSGLGIVTKPANETSHYEFDTEDGQVYIEVELMPNREPIRARLGGGPVWTVPPEGTEVGVIIPNGELESDPLIVSVFMPGVIPYHLDGSKTIILAKAGSTVEIHDGSGSVDGLVKRSEFNNHDHDYSGEDSNHDTFSGTTDKPTAVTGTTVLKAK